MIETLEAQPLEESALKQLSFDEKKILLGAINGVIDKHHAAWLLSVEKRKNNHISENNDALPEVSANASNKEKLNL